ncbi:MAG: hypothetical protein M3R54_01685 [Chloroflexota bacterium]|nr:hypothetical protein [Chloroflexota bacterium]
MGTWSRAGAQGGLALSVVAVALAIVGLAPAFTWIPEVPLLLVAALLPIAGLTITGRRGAADGPVRHGAFAGALAGAMCGAAAGVCYFAFGKPFANLVILPALGLLAGAIIGFLAALPRR